jgi:hypothetical protein
MVNNRHSTTHKHKKQRIVNRTHENKHKRNKTCLDNLLYDKPCTYNLGQRRVRLTTIAVEEQEVSHILSLRF